MNVDRRTYADHYGPTTGDRVRLADTALVCASSVTSPVLDERPVAAVMPR